MAAAAQALAAAQAQPAPAAGGALRRHIAALRTCRRTTPHVETLRLRLGGGGDGAGAVAAAAADGWLCGLLQQVF